MRICADRKAPPLRAQWQTGSNALASYKICYGSTKSQETKGLVMLARIDSQKISLKTIKGDYVNGTYPADHSSIAGRDGKTYLQYKGENDFEYQNFVLVDKNLLHASTTGLLQIRARGEGFFNAVFVCRDVPQQER